jgi:hypothetical protein
MLRTAVDRRIYCRGRLLSTAVNILSNDAINKDLSQVLTRERTSHVHAVIWRSVPKFEVRFAVKIHNMF